jgi:uncharacterized protein (TIGR02466 family)
MTQAGEVELTTLEPLFYSPLIWLRMPGYAALNRKLLSEVGAMRTRSSGLQRSNRGGWHSATDLFHRPEPGCRELSRRLLEAVRVATLTVSPSFDLGTHAVQAEGWFNVLAPGGMHTPHDHPAWVWSGCYYASLPTEDAGSDAGEVGGELEFLDSRTNIRTLTVDGADCFKSKARVRPHLGAILMFPSYLLHWVTQNTSDKDRISVAFNARFVPVKPA